MFDIGFSELLIIGVVALVVVGPERLPKLARMAGQWLGRLNRYVSQVKQDIDRDMRVEELRKMQQEMKDTAQKYEIMATETARKVEDGVAEERGQISEAMHALGTADGGGTVAEGKQAAGQVASGTSKAAGEAPVAADAAGVQAAPNEAVHAGSADHADKPQA